MAKIAKNTDNTTEPSKAKENQSSVNFTDQANFDHFNDRNLNNLMKTIIDSEMPMHYKIERCKLIIETFTAGSEMFKQEGNVQA